MDGEISKNFARTMKKQGMKLRLGSKVTGAKAGKAGVKLTVEPAKGGDAETIDCDTVLVAIGRRPYTEGLGLDKAGVEVGPRGFIKIDDHFKTSVDGIYAIGDCVPGPMLAHKAEDEGAACAEIIAGQVGSYQLRCDPRHRLHMAGSCVGRQTEEQLKEAGDRIPVRQIPLHRQQPRTRQHGYRRLRQDPGRRKNRPRAGRPYHRPGRRQL